MMMIVTTKLFTTMMIKPGIMIPMINDYNHDVDEDGVGDNEYNDVGWFFMGPVQFLWFFKVPGWFFEVPDWFFMVPGGFL